MKTGIMALAIAVVLLMATVQTVAAAAFTAVGNVDYEDGTQVPYGWTVEVWNLDEPELGLQPWHTVTEFTPIAYEYGTSCEYESEDDLIKVRVTSPDGTYVGVNFSRWGDIYIGPSKKTCSDVVVHVNAKRGTCYEDTMGEGTVVSENLSCSECFALPVLAGANSWSNYEFESQCNPGYMVGRYCYNASNPCPQCCDGLDNDADSGIDWSETDAGDSWCACPLDNTEDYDEGCPVPCVPEVATVVMVGIGLMMLVGLIRYRRT